MDFIMGGNYLKKAAVGTLGEENLIGGDFLDGTGWVVFGATGGNTVVFNGVAEVTQVATLVGFHQYITLANSVSYRVSYEITNNTSGGLRLKIYGTTYDLNTTVGVHEFDIVATSSVSEQLMIYGGYYGTASVNSIDNLSIKEIL